MAHFWTFGMMCLFMNRSVTVVGRRRADHCVKVCKHLEHLRRIIPNDKYININYNPDKTIISLLFFLSAQRASKLIHHPSQSSISNISHLIYCFIFFSSTSSPSPAMDCIVLRCRAKRLRMQKRGARHMREEK